MMFLYLIPCLFVDVTESWVSATKIQRLATIIAGIWIEMTVCGIAMIVWSNTLTGEWLHDFAYQIILLTGIAVVAINLNPLIKLDGYYFLTEVIEIPDLKERSTSFLSAWFQHHVLRIPVEVPIVPRRRAPLFILYVFASEHTAFCSFFSWFDSLTTSRHTGWRSLPSSLLVRWHSISIALAFGLCAALHNNSGSRAAQLECFVGVRSIPPSQLRWLRASFYRYGVIARGAFLRHRTHRRAHHTRSSTRTSKCSFDSARRKGPRGPVASEYEQLPLRVDAFRSNCAVRFFTIPVV